MSMTTHTVIDALRSSDVNPLIQTTSYAISRDINGSVLILNRSLDEIQQLNPVGSFIWSQLQKKAQTFQEILILIQDEFDVLSLQARIDLIDFLDLLQQRNLIELTQVDEESK